MAPSELEQTKAPKIAQMIKLYISIKEITQAELATEWETSGACVSRFLSGEGMPDGKTTARIIAWLLQP